MKMKSAVQSLVLFTLAFLILACNQRASEQSATALEVPDSVYISKGDNLIALTFDTLRNSLLAAIGEQGFAHAVQFCNEKAYSLTTQYTEEGITIRRASPQYRNPGNEPDSLEAAVFTAYQSSGASPKLLRTSDEVHYIKPIIMQAMCLNCHGKVGTDIKTETLSAIQNNYPNDKATGYAEGDLRGIWHIAFRLSP